MIVVVIVALLAAIAIPSAKAAYRRSVSKAMASDARHVAAGCLQIAGLYPTETNGLVFRIDVFPDGSLRNAAGQGGGAGVPQDEIAKYTKKITRGTNQPAGLITFRFDAPPGAVAFSLTNIAAVPSYVVAVSNHAPNQSTMPGDPVDFDEEGKPL